LKCCLNYELDTYLDALKDIPDRIENLDTEAGYARHQKTDIFKKIMWFSYQGDENWIPVKAARVKEIMAMNKAGKKAPNLKEEAVQIAAPVVVEKSFDYENVVGQDSLTRLDERSRGKNNQNRNNNQKNNRSNSQNKRERIPAGEKNAGPNNRLQQPQQGAQKAQQGGKQQPNGPKPQQNSVQKPQQAVPKPQHVNGPKPQNSKPKQQPQAQKPVVKAESNITAEGIKPEQGKNKNRNNRRKNNNRRNNNNGSENKPAAE